MRGMLKRLVGAAALALCAGFAVSAQAQDQPAADPAAIEAAERAAQQMEEMFEDMPMDFNPAGMTSGEGVFGAMFGPSVTKADFKMFIKILALDKDQTEAAETVYAQRLENYEAKGKPMQELMVKAFKDLGESIGRGEGPKDPENVEELKKAALEIQAEREAMAKGVMEDLKSLATTAQLEQWPKVEMAERRNVLMRSQVLMMAPGSLVDVRATIEGTLAKKGMEQPGELQAKHVVQALESLDFALDELARIVAPLDSKMRAIGMNNKPTEEETQDMMKMMGEASQVAERVRKANEIAVNAIASVLPDATKAAFMEDFNARAYPAIYRVMHSERLLEAASAMTDLTDEQREKIKQMREEHTAKFKELRPKAVERMIEQQSVQSELMGAKDDDARMKAMDRMNKLYSSENPRDKMREADKEIVKQVRGLLTDAQREKLPKRPRPSLPFDIKPAGDDGSK
jgi:hypothetical protein